MNLQLNAENIILDTFTSLKNSLQSLFTSSPAQKGNETEHKQDNKTKRENSLERLNRVL